MLNLCDMFSCPSEFRQPSLFYIYPQSCQCCQCLHQKCPPFSGSQGIFKLTKSVYAAQSQNKVLFWTMRILQRAVFYVSHTSYFFPHFTSLDWSRFYQAVACGLGPEHRTLLIAIMSLHFVYTARLLKRTQGITSLNTVP